MKGSEIDVHLARIKEVLEKEDLDPTEIEKKLKTHISQLRKFHRRHRFFWKGMLNREVVEPKRRHKKDLQHAQHHISEMEEALKKKKFKKVKKLVLALETLSIWRE